MITYFVTAAHRYTMDSFLDTWGGALRSMIQIRVYDEMASLQWLPAGTHIFSDLERLTPAQCMLAAEVWAQLEAAGPNVRLLNHPEKAMRRTALLQALYAAGRNQFNACSVIPPRPPMRYPVFLRCANDHEGSRTELLHSPEAVETNIHTALSRGHNPLELLLVEYCNASGGNGIHHKFSAFRAGSRIIPRHLIFSRKWILKYPDLLDDEKIAQERRYLETNPHETALRETFELAHIDYGRCDYALVDGRIQVWEINTNPVVMLPPEEYQPPHLPAQEYFAERIRGAFEALNLPADPRLKIPIRFDRSLWDRILTQASR